MNRYLRAIAVAATFFLLSVAAVYCGVAFALSSRLVLSPANTEYALLRGYLWGSLFAVLAVPVGFTQHQKVRGIGLALGFALEALLFASYFIHTATIAAC